MVDTEAASPAPVTPALPVQIATAQTIHTPPAPPAHAAQAVPPVSHQPAHSGEVAPPTQSPQTTPPAKTPVPASPAPGVTAPKTAPPTAPATAPAVVDPVQDATGDVTVDDNGQTSASIDLEAEAILSAQITKLYVEQKNGKATVKRTRAEMKALRLELAEKLYIMKLILARTGRGGGWAAYLRAQKLPLTSADRLVAQHEATLTPAAEKVTTGELSTSTVEEIRQLARKTLLKVSRFLTTQELTYEFVHELIWGIDVAEMSYTDLGLELPKIGSDDAPEAGAPVAKPASPAPAAP